MGRKKRTQAVDKTTVYFLESDLNKIDSKNRKRALRIAKEISLRAVGQFCFDYKEETDFEGYYHCTFQIKIDKFN